MHISPLKVKPVGHDNFTSISAGIFSISEPSAILIYFSISFSILVSTSLYSVLEIIFLVHSDHSPNSPHLPSITNWYSYSKTVGVGVGVGVGFSSSPPLDGFDGVLLSHIVVEQ